ncbi:MAG: serine protease [Oligoflexia bacterium]|nr:serine protease [Oligoflexia bacterium]
MGRGKTLVILCVFIFTYQFAHAEEGFHPLSTLAPIFQRTEKATVCIYAVSSNGKTARGTAFLVGTKIEKNKTIGIFLTNAHVVERIKSDFAYNSRVQVGYHYQILGTVVSTSDANSWITKLTNYGAKDSDLDMALVEIEMPKGRILEPVQFKVDPVSAGDQVYLLGNPALNMRKVWNVPKPEIYLVTLWSQGIVSGYAQFEGRKNSKLQHRTLWHTADTLEGNSGGPVMDSSGYVVGITKARMGSPELNKEYKYIKHLKGVALPAKEIQEFLRAQGIY